MMRWFRAYRSGYIVSPLYDWVGFIGAPLIGLAIAAAVHARVVSDGYVEVGFYSGRLWELIVLILMTQCHLFITVIRAYGNPVIYRAFRYRLIMGPLILVTLGVLFPIFLVVQLVVNTWWDAYHSACQTFGFCRLYDAKVGDRSVSLRHLDRIMNVLIYMGPILGGVTLIDHLQTFRHFSVVGVLFLAEVPAKANAATGLFLTGVMIFGAIFIPYYVARYIQHAKSHAVSVQKVMILIITAVVSVLAWGFNSFGMAFIVANFFHAWQYYAMMIWSEKTGWMTRFERWLFRPQGERPTSESKTSIGGSMVFLGMVSVPIRGVRAISLMLAVGVFVAVTGLFGWFLLFMINPNHASRVSIAVLATVATCHFWFDGFIWSVQKKHV